MWAWKGSKTYDLRSDVIGKRHNPWVVRRMHHIGSHLRVSEARMSDLGFEVEEAIIEYADTDSVAYLQNPQHRAMLAEMITRRLKSKGWGNQKHEAELDGLDVELYRGRDDGKLVVDLATGGLALKDEHPEHRIPNIRLRINEQGLEFKPDGTLFDIDGGEV